MEFSLLYELANPKPWHARSEYNKWWEGLDQVVLAEQLGFDGRLGGRASLPRRAL